jgi:hypothetical protein
VDNKKKRQDMQAKQMIERRAKHAKESGAALGALVRIGKDKRDVSNPRSGLEESKFAQKMEFYLKEPKKRISG